LFITYISEKHTAFIFYPKNGGSMFLEALIPAYQNVWCHNPEPSIRINQPTD